MKTVKLISVCCAILLIAVMLTPACFAADAAQTYDAVLYVSPAGNDGAAGTADAPLATLQGAKARLQTLPDKPDTALVSFAAGVYSFTQTVQFDETDLPNVTYAAADGARVVFSGAYPVSGFTEETVNGARVFTKEIDRDSPLIHAQSLFRGDERLQTPRYPAEGYLRVASVNEDDSLFTEDTTFWDFTLGQVSFNAAAGDIDEAVFAHGAPTVRILHYWHDEMMYAEGYDAATGRVKLSRPSTMLIRPEDRYYFENVFSELDAPGEWYMDAENGKLYYVPEAGETADSLTLYASSLRQLIHMDGARGIRFENIAFEKTDWQLAVAQGGSYGEYGMDSSQAAVDVDGAVRVERAEDVGFYNCEFRNLGATAVKFLDGVKNGTVQGCIFENIAATAVFAGGQNVAPDDPAHTSGIRIENNLIHDYGRIFFNAIGVQFTYCSDSTILHNEIYNGYYSAISCGWIWGYTFNATRNIDISYNLIYNIGQGWLSDMGGIYMLGRQPGTRLTHNVIHNVAADPGQGGYGGWGIYLDEGSSDMLVEKNLVFCCSSQGLNIHYGEGNLFRNNISAFNREGQVSPGSREESHATAFYYNNIFLTDGSAPVYVYMLGRWHFYDNGNLMWDMSKGETLYFTKNSADSEARGLSATRLEGFLHNALTADPLFADARAFDFTLAEDSPAFGLNFEAWDYAQAGTLADTVLGLDTPGGQTAYNAGAAMPESFLAANTPSPLRMVLYILTPALLLAAAILAAVRLQRAGKRRRAALAYLVMLPLAGAIYFLFTKWNPVAYAVCFVAFNLIGCLAPTALFGARGKKRAIFYVAAALAGVVLFNAVCLLLNNALHLGEATAIVETLAILSAAHLAFVAAVRAGKAPAPKQ